MRSVVCVGEVSIETMLNLFADGGLRQPYRVVTMDGEWQRAAWLSNRPCIGFTSRSALIQFVRTHEIVCIYPRVYPGYGDTEAMALTAAMHALGAVDFPLARGA